VVHWPIECQRYQLDNYQRRVANFKDALLANRGPSRDPSRLLDRNSAKNAPPPSPAAGDGQWHWCLCCGRPTRMATQVNITRDASIDNQSIFYVLFLGQSGAQLLRQQCPTYRHPSWFVFDRRTEMASARTNGSIIPAHVLLSLFRTRNRSANLRWYSHQSDVSDTTRRIFSSDME